MREGATYEAGGNYRRAFQSSGVGRVADREKNTRKNFYGKNYRGIFSVLQSGKIFPKRLGKKCPNIILYRKNFPSKKKNYLCYHTKLQGKKLPVESITATRDFFPAQKKNTRISANSFSPM